MSGLSLKCYIGGTAKSELGVGSDFQVNFPTFSQFSRRPLAMTGAFRWRWLSCWAVFTAAVVVLPVNARAGCTHPWIQQTAAASSLTDLALFGLNDHPADSEPGLPVPAQRPGTCAGGACSQPSGFPLPSSTQIPSRIELWGQLSFESPPLVPMADGFCLEPGYNRPRRSLSPIERPPRRLTIR